MKKALIVIDFQNDFVDGSLSFKGASSIENIIVSKIDACLKNGDDLIFTLDTHFDNYLESKEGLSLPIKHCIKNTKGHALYGEVARYEDKASKIFEKNTFGSLDLANFLREKNYSSVELCGLVSHICLLSNAIIAKSALPEADIIVDRKATLSFNPDLHEKTFDLLKGLFIKMKQSKF